MDHPLTTAQNAASATISPAAQLLLSGADRGMFIVGAGKEEVIIVLLLFGSVCILVLRSMQSDRMFTDHMLSILHHLNFLSVSLSLMLAIFTNLYLVN